MKQKRRLADQVEGEQPEIEEDEIPEAEMVETQVEDEPTEEESVEERPMDEIFSLRPDLMTPAATIPEEEPVVETSKKKKKKKKHIKLEYDPDLDEMIVTKKHKRDANDYGEDW